jgi:hypothetical protein
MPFVAPESQSALPQSDRGLVKMQIPEAEFQRERSGVIASPYKGKKIKLISLDPCPVEPLFQEIREASHVSVIGAVSFGLNLLPPLFLTVSDINYRDPKLERLQESFRIFRRPKGHITTEMIIYSV